MLNRTVDVHAYFVEHHVGYKVQGDELVIECPYCGKDGHLYVNSNSGLWKCHRCSVKGAFTSLVKRLGGDVETNLVSAARTFGDLGGVIPPPPAITLSWDQYRPFEDALHSDNKTMEWLRKERLLNDETIRYFKLGKKNGKFSKKNNASVNWVMIPLVRDGEMVNVKYRTTGEYKKDYTQIQGGRATLFNHDGIRPDEPLFLCEGEFDAMVLWQNGYTNVVSTSGGANTFPTEFYDKITSLKPQIVYIVYDTDEPGKNAAEELQRRFGDTARKVDLGKPKDITDYFKEHSKEEFQKLLNQSSLSVVESVSDSVDVFASLVEQVHQQSLQKVTNDIVTPWMRVNSLIDGGMEPGEMIVLSARAKIGKTTFAMNIASELALRGIPSLFFCLEMRPERIMKKMCSYLLKKEFKDLDVPTLSTLAPVISNYPLYFGYSWKDLRIEKIQSIFERAVARFGIRFIVFDNLHFLVRSSTNVVQEIAIYSKAFKRMAESMKVPLMLIAQPRKTSEEMISSEDLKDSSAIKADADKIILLHRTQMLTDVTGAIANDSGVAGATGLDEALHPITIVKVDASRYSPGGTAMLWYQGNISEFTDATPQQIGAFKGMYAKHQQESSNHHRKYTARQEPTDF